MNGWIRWAGCALAATLLGSPVLAAGRPNILIFVAEDLSGRIGAFGDPVASTPQIDRLAGQGVRYPNTFTTAGVCAPSRAALIMGTHQISFGAQHMRTSSRPGGGYTSVPPPEMKAFPELLRAAGYHTFVSQKLDYQFSGVFNGSGPFTIWDAEGVESWQGRPDGAPFFGMINLQETHESGVFRPLGSWPHSAMHFVMQLLVAYRDGLSSAEPATDPSAIGLPPYYPDTPGVREDLARHYDNIARMDTHVGEILANLEADGLADSTIVVWTTDHGDGLPRAKRELYDSGIRVPMIIRWPEALRPEGVAPGDVDARLVSFVDLAPTILEWAGAPKPGWLHGRSLSGDVRRYIHASRDRIDEVHDRQRAIRDARFKYIRSWHPAQPGGHRLAFRDNLESMRDLWRLREAGELDAAQSRWFEPPGAERLFDLDRDPHELRDVGTDPAYAADLARMRGDLEAWLERVGDTSERSEDEMVAAFWPGGEQLVTPAPVLEVVSGRVAIRTATEGASIGYRLGDGAWKLYTGPFALPPGRSVSAKAVRYGWQESETRSLTDP
ncbi:MAG: sulfatase-like hydrolase/transferase [Myxococcota bacterium]